MKKKTLILCAGLFALAAVLTALGQTQSQTQPTTQSTIQPPGQSTNRFPTQANQPSQGPGISSDAQNSFDGQGSKRYLVGPGDVLDVRVFGQSDLNSTVEIDDEGNISSLPFLEDPLPAMCHTEKEIQKTIAEAYAKYLRKPRVSVRVLERKSRPPAVVFGAVRAPTRIQMMRRVRLHELLVAAGGITMSASGSIQIIHTEKELCADRGGFMVADLSSTTSTSDNPAASDGPPAASDKLAAASAKSATSSEKRAAASSYTEPVTDAASDKLVTTTARSAETPTSETPLVRPASDKSPSDIGQIDIYQTGDVRIGLGKDDPYIRPGDIVIVTEGEPIYITGAVIAPGGLTMKDGMTLGRAMAMAGGLQKLAKSHEVHIYRQVKGKVGSEKMTIDYDAIKNGKKPDMLLQAYDIIDVRMQGSFSPQSLKEILLGIAKGTVGSVGSIGSSLPYRVIY